MFDQITRNGKLQEPREQDGGREQPSVDKADLAKGGCYVESHDGGLAGGLPIVDGAGNA